MDIYLVGGAVRDKLLGLPVKERDWVVIGATPEDMLAEGFRPVGKDFPVFLHPQTHEEYALARTERKTGPGYTGFEFHASPDVTLEEDLIRRDLTINAMAEDANGSLIDPYNGQEDLQNGVLRHVSPAFTEDPVRILRVARFAARFARWGFHVAHDTNKLMRTMVDSGEVDALVPERVWAELEKALGEEHPARFFEVLRGCGALTRLFPEIDALFPDEKTEPHVRMTKIAQTTPVHALHALEQSVHISDDTTVRFAALALNIGKGIFTDSDWPKMIDPEPAVDAIKAMCERIAIPKAYKELAIIAARHHNNCHCAGSLSADEKLDILEAADAFHRSERLNKLVAACMADTRGRVGHEKDAYPSAKILMQAFHKAKAINMTDINMSALKGKDIAREVRRLRIEAISAGE